MKAFLVTALLLTLALNTFASEVVGLKSNNPPLSGDLKGVKECQYAEVSEDSIVFKTFFYKEKENGNGVDVYSVMTSEQNRIKAFKQPTFTKPQMSVITPPDKDLFKLTFDGNPNKDKSAVLDLSLKLCVSMVKEKKLEDINLFLKKQLLQAEDVLNKVPQALNNSFQLGYIKGISENTIASFVQGQAVGRIEGLAVGYEKGAVDGLGAGFKLGVYSTLEAISQANGKSGGTAVQGYDRISKPTWNTNQGAYTRTMKDSGFRPVSYTESSSAGKQQK